MPLPEQLQFENLLQSMTPVRPIPGDGFAVEQVVPRAPARDESGHFSEQECYVWYRSDAGLNV